ncbi:unnamed protein product [Polarella glacialis]|uniref:Uncharacterized protein n=1 Tax=Polarella glacialis TaxID=89957 RepID=A0A813EPV3_POLGL|nr:unnamed protein product [Polarella glacialis]
MSPRRDLIVSQSGSEDRGDTPYDLTPPQLWTPESSSRRPSAFVAEMAADPSRVLAEAAWAFEGFEVAASPDAYNYNYYNNNYNNNNTASDGGIDGGGEDQWYPDFAAARHTSPYGRTVEAEFPRLEFEVLSFCPAVHIAAAAAVPRLGLATATGRWPEAPAATGLKPLPPRRLKASPRRPDRSIEPTSEADVFAYRDATAVQAWLRGSEVDARAFFDAREGAAAVGRAGPVASSGPQQPPVGWGCQLLPLPLGDGQPGLDEEFASQKRPRRRAPCSFFDGGLLSRVASLLKVPKEGPQGDRCAAAAGTSSVVMTGTTTDGAALALATILLCESFRTILGEAAEVAEAVERHLQYQDHLNGERSDAGSELTEGERVPKAHVVALDSPKSPVSTTRPSALFLPSDTKVMLAELEQDLADLGAGAGPPARAEQIHEQAESEAETDAEDGVAFYRRKCLQLASQVHKRDTELVQLRLNFAKEGTADYLSRFFASDTTFEGGSGAFGLGADIAVWHAVCVCGGSGGIGQPLSLLMAMDDNVKGYAKALDEKAIDINANIAKEIPALDKHAVLSGLNGHPTTECAYEALQKEIQTGLEYAATTSLA